METKPTVEPFHFEGNGVEYFKIWIVNTFLTLITLGIYSAWAKVRSHRYLYGHTVVADASFDYLANPINILKGRLIAVAIFGTVTLASSIYPLVAPLTSLLLLFAVPWMMVQSLRFHHHYTAYRNVRFRFRGTVSDAIGFYFINGILITVTLGLYFPFFMHKFNEFVVGNSAYGQTDFVYKGEGGRYYVIYLKGIALFIAFGIVLAMAFSAMEPLIKSVMPQPTYQTYETNATVAPYEAYVDDEAFPEEDNPGMEDYPEVEEGNLSMEDYPQEDEMSYEPGQDPSFQIMAMLFTMLIFFPIFIFFYSAHAFIKPMITNYLFSVTSLGAVGLRSEMHAGTVLWITLSNAVAVVFSLGLLYPWAKIRMLRYRLGKTALLVEGSLDGFLQIQEEGTSSAGQEVGDMFDMDFGF